jgi:hypothetical protein
MSVTAKKLDDWYSEGVQCQVETQTIVDGETSKLQWRDHFTITLVRKFAMMTAFYSETRKTRTSFSFKTGGGAQCFWSCTGKKFFCTSDEPRVMDTITGEGDESQTWEHYTDWEDIPNTHYP